MKKVLIIGRQILKGCLRARSLSLVIFYFFSLVIFMSMLSSSDSAYRKALIIDSGLSLINIFGLFLVALVILPIYQNEKSRHTLVASLSFDVSRAKYLWGLWSGSGAALLINYLAMSLLLISTLLVLGVPVEFGIFRQLFLNFCELLALGSFAITFSVFFSNVVATMLTFSIYLVGHMTTSFHEAVYEWKGSLIGRALDLVWAVMPDLSLFNLKDIVVKNSEIPFYYEMVALIYALSMIFIAMEIARYRLNRENLM
ncbi:MAG: hypothetical protein PWR01_4535 [Clostridiales bacterium]|nr:hypothetical protein [Clostridiales bacterium]MDN5283462.1 hypothetical protein [Candidatus Ozemobacter sp.]